MVWHVGAHRADHADIVDALGGFREKLAHFDAALPVFLKLEHRRERRPGLALGPQVLRRQRLPLVLGKRGLRVERVDVRRPAVHEQVDDALGLRRELGQPRRQRVDLPGRRGRFRSKQSGLLQQRRQRQAAHAHATAAEQIAPGKRMVIEHSSNSRITCGLAAANRLTNSGMFRGRESF